MKLIDEKGRLFGIINIIDLTIVLVLLMVVVGGIKRFKAADIEIEESTEVEKKNAIVTLEARKIKKYIVDGLAVGDDLYHDKKGGKLGEIIDIDVENEKEKVKDSDGETVYKDVPDSYNVTVQVKSKAEDRPKEILIGDRPVRVGNKFDFKNKKVKFTTTITGIEIE